MFIYLAQVSICTAAFFALYWLVFSRFSFYRFNRFYLLFTFTASFLIPVISIKVEQKAPVEKQQVIAPIETGPVTIHENFDEKGGVATTNWDQVALFGYAAISAGMLALFLYKLSALLVLCRKKGIRREGMTLITRERGATNCSFFNYIFIDKRSFSETELNLFLAHEKLHAQQYHSADRLLLSLAKAVLWFNPFAWLYSREITLQHEYEADEFVSAAFGKTAYAHMLLAAATRQPGFYGLSNAFAKKPVKSRIHRIFKPNTTKMKRSLYVMVLPLLALLGWNYSIKKVYPSASPAEKFTVVVDAGHGGSDNGAQANGLYEKDLTLALAKALSAQLKSNNIDVVMTRDGDELVSLADRVRSKGDFFMSLHVNSTHADNSKEGISMLVPLQSHGGRTLSSINMSSQVFETLKNNRKISIAKNPLNTRVKVLEESSSPALLLELGYMTNPKDLKYVSSTSGQEEIAAALANAIIKYRDSQAKN